MSARKKRFNPPNPIFVIFDTIFNHPVATYATRKDLDRTVKDAGLADDEVVVEYYLATQRTPKSKEL